jgi:hypothetical protein
MSHLSISRLAGYLALLTLPGLVAAFNFVALSEAFGDGPPYFSRTTNMDKWTNPLPILLAIDTAVLMLTALGLVLIRRLR